MYSGEWSLQVTLHEEKEGRARRYQAIPGAAASRLRAMLEIDREGGVWIMKL
jgi:hypothetical protein